jgi:hypothetical protein
MRPEDLGRDKVPGVFVTTGVHRTMTKLEWASDCSGADALTEE